MLYTLSQSLMQCTWALYTEFRYGWTPAAIGFSIFALGCSITVVQGLPAFSAHQSLFNKTAGSGGTCMRHYLLSLHRLFSHCIPCSHCRLCGSPDGNRWTDSAGCYQRTAPLIPSVRLGAMSSINSFTGAISPLIGTPLLFFTSSFEPDSLAAGTPFFLCALIVAVALILSLRFPLPEETQRYS